MNRSRLPEKIALAAALFAGDVSAGANSVDPESQKQLPPEILKQQNFETLKSFILDTQIRPFFENPEYFEYHEGGKFSEEEEFLRWSHIPHVGDIFHDVGVDFYEVSEGETLDHIKEKLLPLYVHLAEQKGRMNGFNIFAKDVHAGMMLPIPVESKERKISDEEFLRFAYESLGEMLVDPDYGDFIRVLLEHYSEEEIILRLLAIAKQESGGRPIGQFELHRYEPQYKTFSYSIFHILMMGPGEKARQELGMTIGQTYHPKNAIKLFFAFMIEKLFEGKSRKKSRENVEEKFVKLFALDQDFARFYNGKKWEMLNPEYLANIYDYYNHGRAIFLQNGIEMPFLEEMTKTP